MIKELFLLSPVFVSLFWFAALAGDKRKFGTPRLFLSKFMLLTGFIFFSHFLYFAPYRNIYPYFDIPLQFIGLSVFPVYHIYFRLLTVDEKFSFNKHSKYLIVSTIITLVYFVAVVITPFSQYTTWLFNKADRSVSPYPDYLEIIRTVMLITMLLQLIITVTGNYILIRKYGDKAEQYYSNIPDKKNENAKMLNFSLIVASIASFVLIALGRYFLFSQDFIICIGWSVFTISLFIIGELGIKQLPINPAYETAAAPDVNNQPDEMPQNIREQLMSRIFEEFETNKIYLKNDLNIMDVVKLVGTNRTYVSSVINQNFNNNFSSYVNSFRIRELKMIIEENPGLTIQILAERCGFGSANSMKRAIMVQTGLSFSDWKNRISIKKQNKILEHQSE